MAMTPRGPEASCVQLRHLKEECVYSSQCHGTLKCNTVSGPGKSGN